jgi:hypothetical protein
VAGWLTYQTKAKSQVRRFTCNPAKQLLTLTAQGTGQNLSFPAPFQIRLMPGLRLAVIWGLAGFDCGAAMLILRGSEFPEGFRGPQPNTA